MAIGEATEFVPPLGERKRRSFEFDDDLKFKYAFIKSLGLKFTAEQLGTGMLSLTLTDWENGDYFIEVQPPPVDANKIFESFIKKFNDDDYEKWKEMVVDGVN